MDSNNSKALVDNWLLEHSAIILDWGLKPTPFDQMIWSKGTDEEWRKEFEDRLLSFLQFLDVLVLHDQLIYVEGFSGTWKRYNKIKAFSDRFREVSFNDIKSNELLYNLPQSEDGDNYGSISSVVREGARKYLSLGRDIGIAYWPAPERARYIETYLFQQVKDSFISLIRGRIDSAVEEIADTILSFDNKKRRKLMLPNFGTALLANCESKDGIFRAVFDFKNNIKFIAFKNWIWTMQKAVEEANLLILRDSIRDIDDVINEVKKEVGIDNNNNPDLKVQIGLSPSITLNTENVKNFFQKFSKQKLHSAFLKEHFEKILNCADVRVNIKRLFPEVSDRLPGFL